MSETDLPLPAPPLLAAPTDLQVQLQLTQMDQRSITAWIIDPERGELCWQSDRAAQTASPPLATLVAAATASQAACAHGTGWRPLRLACGTGERIARACGWPLGDGRRGALIVLLAADADPEAEASIARSADPTFASAPVSLLQIDSLGFVLHANHCALEQLPRLRDSVVHLCGLFADPAQCHTLTEMLSGNNRCELTAQLRADTDETHWFRIQVAHVPDHPPVSHVLSLECSDGLVALRERESQSIGSARNTIRRALTPLLVIEARSGKVAVASQRMQTMLGEDAAPLLNDNQPGWRLLRHLPDHALRRQIIRTIRQGANGLEPLQVEVQDVAGTRRWYLLQLSRIWMLGRTSYMFSFLDIDRIRRANKLLEDALLRERQINDLHREFVALVSHEFRTPLAVIDASAQRLIRRGTQLSPDDIVERAQRIRGATAGLVTMVEQLLENSRQDGGSGSIHITRFDIAQLLRECLQQRQELSPLHRLELHVDDEVPRCIDADRHLIEQLINNLLSNAVKYSPAGGRIAIHASTRQAMLELSIADPGMGIPAAEQEKVFERYYRASSGKGISGTGLGLYLCRQIVEMHGGRIWLHSAPGLGTTVSLRLPLPATADCPETPTTERAYRAPVAAGHSAPL